MDAGSIFLIIALILVVALFIGRPFFARTGQSSGEKSGLSEGAEHRRSALLAERDRLLTALQELDFDQRLGKIPAEDYPAMRASLLKNAALVLRRLDEYQAPQGRETAEERIEQAIAARRADASAVKRPAQATAAAPAVAAAPAAAASVPDDLEERIAARRREREEKSAGFCPKCGQPASKSDRFCSKCGAVL